MAITAVNTITNRAGFSDFSQADIESALARRYAPRLRFDRREPFLPSAVGYTVFWAEGRSRSFPRRITFPPGAVLAIEYAIWWDWDIQHLYELEHVWVYVGPAGCVIAAEASWHGRSQPMTAADGRLPLQDGRLTLYAEPGKHAFAPSADALHARRDKTDRNCGPRAGYMGVHVTSLFARELRPLRTASANRLVRRYLEGHTFRPSYVFCQTVDLADLTVVPWANLHAWIPQRVAWWLGALAQIMPPESDPPRAESVLAPPPHLLRLDLSQAGGDLPAVAHYTLAELRALVPPSGQESFSLFEEIVWVLIDGVVGLHGDTMRFAARVRRWLRRFRRRESHSAPTFSLLPPPQLAQVVLRPLEKHELPPRRS